MNTRPFVSILQAVGATIALLVLAAPARADVGGPGEFNCFDSRAAKTFFNPSYVTCSQNYNSEPAPQVTFAPFAGYGDFYFVGQTRNNNSDSGPFQAFGLDFTEGTLTLDLPQKGTFVIALSSFDDYALYLYDANKFPGGVSSIKFSTFGTTNEKPQPFQLEYANLYAPIPEPTTYALMLSGLTLTGLALRRRKA